MGLSRSVFRVVVGTSRIAGSAAKLAVKGTAATLNLTQKLAQEHEHKIAAASKVALGGAGLVVKGTGVVVAIGADAAGRRLHKSAATSDRIAGKLLGHVAGYTADAVVQAAKVTATVGSVTVKAAPAVGATTGGAVAGVFSTASGAVDSFAIPESEIKALRLKLRRCGEQSRRRSEQLLHSESVASHGGRKRLLDGLFVGGMTLSSFELAPASVPAEIHRAFELAYPGLAAGGETFVGAVGRMSPRELMGLVNGVKGKLFEMRLVEQLNSGGLPDGLRAELSTSATQPGYDILVRAESGQVVDTLSAKATESASYVKEALTRYPDIDVTTTTEVHAQLMALGSATGVTDSGISEAVLQQKVEAAAHGSSVDLGDLMPSTVGMAIFAMSAFMDRSLTFEQRGAKFGGRAARATLPSIAGKAALVASGTWWMGLAAGIGSGWLANYGINKRQRYEALKRAADAMTRREVRIIRQQFGRAPR